MKKITCIMLGVLFIVCNATSSWAYVMDGDLSDWGVDLFVDWVPDSPTADYVEQDDWINWPHYYTENVDLEALYFDDDNRYAYVGYVSTLFQHYYPYAGDMALDLDGDGQYEYGICIKGLKEGAGKNRPLQYLPTWKMPSNSQMDESLVKAAGPFHIGGWQLGGPNGEGDLSMLTGQHMGDVEAWYTLDWDIEGDIKGGGSAVWKWTWTLEMRIDKFLFNDLPLSGQVIVLNQTMSCANDYLRLKGDFDHGVIPEPATIFMFTLGALGMGVIRRKRI